MQNNRKLGKPIECDIQLEKHSDIAKKRKEMIQELKQQYPDNNIYIVFKHIEK